MSGSGVRGSASSISRSRALTARAVEYSSGVAGEAQHTALLQGCARQGRRDPLAIVRLVPALLRRKDRGGWRPHLAPSNRERYAWCPWSALSLDQGQMARATWAFWQHTSLHWSTSREVFGCGNVEAMNPTRYLRVGVHRGFFMHHLVLGVCEMLLYFSVILTAWAVFMWSMLWHAPSSGTPISTKCAAARFYDSWWQPGLLAQPGAGCSRAELVLLNAEVRFQMQGC